MANLKTYLQSLLDSFINNTETRQLMSAQSYPTTNDAITVPVTGDASEGWAILALYTAPCDGVITVSGTTDSVQSATGVCYLTIINSIFKNSVVTPETGVSLKYDLSAIVKKGEQVRVDGDSFIDASIKFYKSQGSI